MRCNVRVSRSRTVTVHMLRRYVTARSNANQLRKIKKDLKGKFAGQRPTFYHCHATKQHWTVLITFFMLLCNVPS